MNDPRLVGKKIVIVCDWLVSGGAERVVLELHRMFPEAPIYTSIYRFDKLPEFKDADIRTSALQKWKFTRERHKWFTLYRQHWFKRPDLSEYDIVISSSGAEAKCVWAREGALHINYCHSPTHYYWSRYEEYLEEPGLGILNPIARIILRLLLNPLRRWDFKAAQNPDIIIANSNHIKKMVERYYHRESVVVHPPIDIERFNTIKSIVMSREGYLAVGRQTYYKRIDLAVASCTKLKLPLTVIGQGPQHEALKKMAGPTVTFLTGVSDETIVNYFRSAKALLFPGLDDFGITAVEAMAAGTPVIAYRAGGVLDTVIPEETGIFFEAQTAQSLTEAILHSESMQFNHAAIATYAAQYSPEVFRKNITLLLDQELDK